MTTSNLCRWGILGTAQIARKNWEAIRNSQNASLVAVASRDAHKAQSFIDSCQSQVPFPTPPRATGYEALLADPEIDAVYIPLPTALRKDWVIKAAHAGKHVLCEKPCATHAGHLAEMIDACNAAKVQFMDGVMFMHSARLPALRAVLDDSTSVGDLKRITAQFSFRGPDDFFQDNIRSNHSLEPAGCLGDLGWYTIRIALWVMNYALPTQVSGRILSSVGEPAVPTEFAADLSFEGGVSASFYTSFLTEHQQWAHLSGTKGNVTLEDFVLPFFDAELAFSVSNAHFATDNCKFSMERHSRRVAVPEYATNHPTSQETNMVRTFSQIVLSGIPDPHWPDISLKTQRVLDACLASANNAGIPVAP